MRQCTASLPGCHQLVSQECFSAMGVKHLIHLVATSAIGTTWRWMWIGAGSTSMVGAPGGEKVRFRSGEPGLTIFPPDRRQNTLMVTGSQWQELGYDKTTNLPRGTRTPRRPRTPPSILLATVRFDFCATDICETDICVKLYLCKLIFVQNYICETDICGLSKTCGQRDLSSLD